MAKQKSLILICMDHIKDKLENISTANYRSNVQFVSKILKAPDEIDDDKFPCLFLTVANRTIEKQTNKELVATFNISIYGYIRSDDFDDENNVPSDKLLDLISDVEEMLHSEFQDNKFNESAESFDMGKVETDEGLLEPYAAFVMNFEIQITYSYTNTSLKRW